MKLSLKEEQRTRIVLIRIANYRRGASLTHLFITWRIPAADAGLAPFPRVKRNCQFPFRGGGNSRSRAEHIHYMGFQESHWQRRRDFAKLNSVMRDASSRIVFANFAGHPFPSLTRSRFRALPLNIQFRERAEHESRERRGYI